MERTLDYKGRWRNHTVAFRVSDEEAKLLNDLVALSRLDKAGLYHKAAAVPGCGGTGQSEGL